jgi:hypothetical protein
MTVTKSFHKAFEVFNLRGGPIMGLWSVAMIGLSIYSVVADKKVDSSVAAMYGTAVTAYATSMTYRKVKDVKPS